jgi:alpha-aminoadipate carrier protein LysW
LPIPLAVKKATPSSQRHVEFVFKKECCKIRRTRLDCPQYDHKNKVEVSPCEKGVPLRHQQRGGSDKVPTGTCPECDADVHVDTDADKGDIVACEECGTELEVVGLDPVELDIVEEEDLDEDEDEDEF